MMNDSLGKSPTPAVDLRNGAKKIRISKKTVFSNGSNILDFFGKKQIQQEKVSSLKVKLSDSKTEEKGESPKLEDLKVNLGTFLFWGFIVWANPFDLS